MRTRPNPPLATPAIALLFQSTRLVGRRGGRWILFVLLFSRSGDKLSAVQANP